MINTVIPSNRYPRLYRSVINIHSINEQRLLGRVDLPMTSRTNSGGARGAQSFGLSGIGAGLSCKISSHLLVSLRF